MSSLRAVRSGRWQRPAGWAITALAVALLTVAVAGCGSHAASAVLTTSRSPVRAVTLTLGTAPGPAYPAVAADGSAGFDAVWTGDRTIVTTHWPAATRSWTQSTRLSGGTYPESGVQLAASPSGSAALVWTNGSAGVAQARYRAAVGSAWQPTATLYSSRWAAVSPQVGLDDRGNAFAVWRTGDGAIDLAEHRAGTTAWTLPVTVVKDPRLEAMGFAVSPSGTLALVWEHNLIGGIDRPAKNRLYVKVRPAARTSWLPALSLGAEGGPTLQGDASTFAPGPRIAINSGGSVFVAWQWPHRDTFYPRAALLSATHRWRTPRVVSLPRPGLDAVIAADDRGFATVLWQTSAAIEEADLSPHGRVLALHTLGAGSTPLIATDGKGDSVAAWSNPDTATFRPARQPWCPWLNRGQSPEVQVAIAPNGVAQVIWRRGSDTQTNTAILARTLTRCRA